MKRQATQVALAIPLLIACGAPAEAPDGAEEGMGTLEQAIEGGQTTNGLGALRISEQTESEQYGFGGGIWCSGVLIGPRTFLTSAHCVDAVGSGNVSVRMKVELYDSGKFHCISEPSSTEGHCTQYRGGKAWINPNFPGEHTTVSDYATDFAVVNMSRDFSYIRKGQRQLIWEAPDQSQIGTFKTIGYGVNSDNDSDIEDPPRLASFSLNEWYSVYYKSLAGVLPGQSGDTGMHLCEGDSGGPQYKQLSSTRYVFGLSSAHVNGGSCADYQSVQFATVVGPYMQRIENRMGRTCRHFNQTGLGAVADCW